MSVHNVVLINPGNVGLCHWVSENMKLGVTRQERPFVFVSFVSMCITLCEAL